MSSEREETKNKGYIDEYYEIWVLLSQTREAMYQARSKELKPYKVTPRNAAVLNIIAMIGDRATPTEMSRWLFRKRHSMTEMIDRMERHGLVKKSKDLDRKNMVRVTLTEKGWKLHHIAFKQNDVIGKIVTSLPDEKRRQLRSFLQTLRDHATKECGVKDTLPFPPPH